MLVGRHVAVCVQEIRRTNITKVEKKKMTQGWVVNGESHAEPPGEVFPRSWYLVPLCA